MGEGGEGRWEGVHVPLFPTKFSLWFKYFFDFGVPCSQNYVFVPVFQFYFPFVPLFKKKSLVPQTSEETPTAW